VFQMCTNDYTQSYSDLFFDQLRRTIDRLQRDNRRDPREVTNQGMEFAWNTRHSPAMDHQN